MISFTDRPQDLMTPFFVAKKNGRLRLVLDCRGINERFKEPPSISLAAGASWSQVKIPAGKELFVAQSNITDYFYSLQLPEALQPFFCLPAIPSEALDAWGVPPTERPAADREGMIFPCFRVVPMGWSWAMYWAKGFIKYKLSLGQVLVPSGCSSQIVQLPPLVTACPLIIAYADNLNVAGTDERAVQRAKDGAVQHLRSLGFGVHGFSIDGVKGVVTPIPGE